MTPVEPAAVRMGGGDILAALKQGRIDGRDAQLRAATALLEGAFCQELLKALRGSIPEGGVIPAGAGQEMFEGMLDQSLAEIMALASTSGPGQELYRALRKGPDLMGTSQPSGDVP